MFFNDCLFDQLRGIDGGKDKQISSSSSSSSSSNVSCVPLPNNIFLAK